VAIHSVYQILVPVFTKSLLLFALYITLFRLLLYYLFQFILLPVYLCLRVLPCDAMRCTVLVIVILSVRLSVRPSVCHTRALCPHGSTYDHDFLPYGVIILVSGDITLIPKFEGGHPERRRWMRVGWVRIGDFRPISRCISETVQDTITSRKSNNRFRLVQKSTTLVDPEMTLDGNYALRCIAHMCFGANH